MFIKLLLSMSFLSLQSFANEKQFARKFNFHQKFNQENDLVFKIPKISKGRTYENTIQKHSENQNPFIVNDPLYSEQWHLNNFGQKNTMNGPSTVGADIGFEEAYKRGITGDKKIIVAIIDSGIDLNHPDLKNNIFKNPKEILNGRDDDGNGYIDDLQGWDFFNNNNRPQDENGHGTHVAGIIGAVTNNGIGVAGIAPNVSLLPLKFMNKDGSGNGKAAIAAINYAIKMGATVINASWGSEGDSQPLRAAIQNAEARGILFVTASGNDGFNNNSYPSYPANYKYSNVISVTSSNEHDQFPLYSNYGSESVHIAAPGENILSTELGGKYVVLSGTSMAAPQITALVALMKYQYPQMSAAEIKNKIMKFNKKLISFERMTISQGKADLRYLLTEQISQIEKPNESDWKTQDYLRESPHPVQNNMDQFTMVKVPGAKLIRLIFEKIQFADSQDRICLNSRKTGIVECIHGQKNQFVSQIIPHESVLINLLTDAKQPSWGFKLSKVQFIE